MERDCSKTLERIWEAAFFMEQKSNQDNKDHDLDFEDEDEDEALSLSDLPIKLIKEEDNLRFKYVKVKPRAMEDDDEFDFCSMGGFKYSTTQPLPQMSSADEIFFQGQILPLRLSISSDNSSTTFHRDETGSLERFKTIYSSSSSCSRTNYSPFSINNSTATAGKTPRQRVMNVFHSHPSPKPQIKTSPTMFRSKKSSSFTWDFFRLGMVRMPGMELQDLKHRSSSKRNSIESKSGILSDIGCKCSGELSVTVGPRSGGYGNGRLISEEERKRRKKKMEKEKEKLELSRHRTFEWLKELSHASFPCEGLI